MSGVLCDRKMNVKVKEKVYRTGAACDEKRGVGPTTWEGG